MSPNKVSKHGVSSSQPKGREWKQITVRYQIEKRVTCIGTRRRKDMVVKNSRESLKIVVRLFQTNLFYTLPIVCLKVHPFDPHL